MEDDVSGTTSIRKASCIWASHADGFSHQAPPWRCASEYCAFVDGGSDHWRHPSRQLRLMPMWEPGHLNSSGSELSTPIMSNTHGCLESGRPKPPESSSSSSSREFRTVSSASSRCDLDSIDWLSFSVDITSESLLSAVGTISTSVGRRLATHTINRMGVQLTGISVI